MFCKKCGFQNPDGKTFCDNCGMRLESSEPDRIVPCPLYGPPPDFRDKKKKKGLFARLGQWLRESEDD